MWQKFQERNSKMKRVMCMGILVCSVLILMAGCGTSHSGLQVSRNYAVPCNEFYNQIGEVAKGCEMKVKSSDPDTGVVYLEVHRTMDTLLTGSLVNMVAGDELILKVNCSRIGTTNVWMDSKAKGQIGTDMGRNSRNISTLTEALDKKWPVVAEANEVGEKRQEVAPGK